MSLTWDFMDAKKTATPSGKLCNDIPVHVKYLSLSDVFGVSSRNVTTRSTRAFKKRECDEVHLGQ